MAVIGCLEADGASIVKIRSWLERQIQVSAGLWPAEDWPVWSMRNAEADIGFDRGFGCYRPETDTRPPNG